MRVIFCNKYNKYMSLRYCEFFNQGSSCSFSGTVYWSSIKELLDDEDCPKWEVESVGKPFNCRLLL